MTKSIALSFARVRKAFGRHTALADFSLTVQEGELFGLVGVNGAGKTTLIKCLLDFAAPDAGRIEVFGVPHRETAARRELAFLPERFLPPYYLTGRDFLRYMLTLHRARFAPDRTQAMFEALDLDPRALDLPVRSFSKGMTQKLGLAACLLSNKRLYVLDEPTSGLDPRARALLKRQLLALRSAGRTVFVTSHLLADVEQLCDRMAVLHGGTIRYVGTPAELLARHGTDDMEQAFLRCIESESSPPRDKA
ncbi:MAG: ABC transporter ATP-binding protein [Betaproteobacteria bacterium]|nr:MAG: ABC transporter ATP-binding protein [Betaproteobacteria bacterium]